MGRSSALVACMLVCMCLCAARLAAAGPAEAGGIEVELELVPNARPGAARGVAHVRLDPDGEGSIPFANAPGKLLVRLEGGKVLCDANGDGQIDDEDGEGVAAPRPGVRTATPPALRPTARIAGRDEEYPLVVLLAQRGIVVLASGAHLEGKLGDSVVELHDSNVNGSFADLGVDGVSVWDAGGPGGLSPFGPQGGQLGRVVESGG